MSVVELWGIREEVHQEKIGGDFITSEHKELVAEFSSEKKAREYIEKSKLKQPKRVTYGGDTIFKATSLLRGYQYTEIVEKTECYPPPFDPEV